MKLNVALVFASLLPLTACAVRPIVAPFYGDAGTQPVAQQETLEDEPTVYFASSNAHAFTYCAWLKAEPTVDNLTLFGNVLASGQVTIESARATLEGGDGLTNLLPFDLTEKVPLDASGEWSSDCLPAVDDPTKGGGVFCVNIKCDKAVNLSIGDQMITFAASDKMQIRNVWTSDANAANGRTVAVSTDPGANVYLGVAVNPVVKFYSVQTDYILSAANSESIDTNGGISTNGYRFVVYRGLLDGTNLTLKVESWVRAGKLPCVRTNQVATTATHFERNARFRLCFASACDGSWAKLRVRSFGARMYGEWIDDDLLLLMRNKDWDEMVSRGIAYDSERGEAWGVKACVESTPTQEGEEVAATDEATSLAYSTQTEKRNIKRVVTLHAKSYLLDGFAVHDKDMDWSCTTEGASFTQSSNVFTFASAGKYTLRGYNRKLGESREVVVNLSDGQTFLKYKVGDVTDTAKPYAAALASVTNALANAILSPVAYEVNGQVKTANVANVKHIPSVPVYSSAGRRGNAAVSALSPHTWISAAHWYGLTPSTLTYSDGVKSSTVRTAAGSFVFLRDWAKTNGFSAADAELVSDVAVGRFADDGAVDSSFAPYLMSASTASNAFGTAFAIPAWRSTQVEVGGAVPVLLEGGRDLAYVSGQSSAAEAWTNEGSWAESVATNFARQLAPRPLVESVQALAERKLASDATLFPQCYGGDSGHPTYVNVGGETNILVTQNHTIGGGDSDVVAADILKAWILTNGDEVKEFVYSSKPTARDYIQDGLVAMWDGIENAGWGKHDSTTTTWTDLANGGRDATITGGAWGENYFEYGNKDITFSGTLFDGDFTAEFIISGDATNCQYYATPLTCDSDDFSFFRQDGLYWELKMPDSSRTKLQPFVIKPWYATRSYTNGIDAAYYDGSGSMRYKDTNKTDKGYTGTWYIGGNNGRRLGEGAKIYCVRIYNRVLTAEEIKHNYEIDCKRFGTAADE